MNPQWLSLLPFLICGVFSLPQLRTAPYINIGQQIIVHYNVSDGQDGRPQHDARDWIGLYRKGSCEATGAGPDYALSHGYSDPLGGTPTHLRPLSGDDLNLHERHKCFLHWQYIPYDEPSGRVIFDYNYIKDAGEYDVRYFYGASTWEQQHHALAAADRHGQGYVCEAILETGIHNVTANTFKDATTMAQNTDTRVPGVNSKAIAKLSLADCTCNPDNVTSKITIAQASYGNNCYDSWPAPEPSGLNIQSAAEKAKYWAAYAKNANGGNSAPHTQGNLNAVFAAACDGLTHCNYTLDHSIIGDPAPWCNKEFVVDYTCTGAHHRCPRSIPNQHYPVAANGGNQENTVCREITEDNDSDMTNSRSVQVTCPQDQIRADCLAKRAACMRCALDTVARAGPITVVGRAEGETNMRDEYTAWQNTDGIPGFEVGVN